MPFLPTCIVASGSKMSKQKCPSVELYIGHYVQSCLRFAQNSTSQDRIFFLSPKHGLVHQHEVIAPYRMGWSHRGCIGMDDLKQQIKDKRINHPRGKLVVLGGQQCVQICQELFPACVTPLRGRGTMGKQISWMRLRIEEGNMFKGLG